MDCACKFCVTKEKLVADTLAMYPNLSPDQCLFVATENFVSTIDAHPVVDDPYFLVIPRVHYTAFSQMPRDVIGETDFHLGFLDISVHKKFPGQKIHRIIFEHGQSRDGNKVKSVYHAHLHVIYTDQDVKHILYSTMDALRDAGVAQECCNDLDCNFLALIKEKVSNDQDYLYFNIDKSHVIAFDRGNDKLYSQFFRVVLAQSCGFDFINWKDATPEQRQVFASRLERNLPQAFVF